MQDYAYNPTKAEELLTSIGWKRGADNMWVDDKGEPVVLEADAALDRHEVADVEGGLGDGQREDAGGRGGELYAQRATAQHDRGIDRGVQDGVDLQQDGAGGGHRPAADVGLAGDEAGHATGPQHQQAAALAKEAFATGKTIRQICREKGVLPEDQLEKALDPWRMSQPG